MKVLKVLNIPRIHCCILTLFIGSLSLYSQGRPPKKKIKVSENIAYKEFQYREGEFSRAWQLAVYHDKTQKGIRPGIVFIHGGGWKSGDKDGWAKVAMDFAKKGYTCASISYRLTGEAPFPACIIDVKNAVRYFKAHASEYFLDVSRIGVFGHSAGAHLALMIGLTAEEKLFEQEGTFLETSSAVTAVCASAAPADFWLKAFDNGKELQRLPVNAKKDRCFVEEISPVTHVRKGQVPIMLMHGDKDKTVNFKDNAKSFESACRKAGVDNFTLMLIPGGSHGAFHKQKELTHKTLEKFFAMHLK